MDNEGEGVLENEGYFFLKLSEPHKTKKYLPYRAFPKCNIMCLISWETGGCGKIPQFFQDLQSFADKTLISRRLRFRLFSVSNSWSNFYWNYLITSF